MGDRAIGRARRLAVACTVGVSAMSLALAGCGTQGNGSAASTGRSTVSSAPSGSSPSSSESAPSVDGKTMTSPGKLTTPPVSPDILIFYKSTIPKDVLEELGKVKGVDAIEHFSMGQFFNEETGVTYAAVNPATFRRFAQSGVAQSTAIWDRVADGEMAIGPKLGRKLQDKTGYLTMGSGKDAQSIHIGAYADPVQPNLEGLAPIQAVVNEKWEKDLHMQSDNAVLISTGSTAPAPVYKAIRKIIDPKASVQILSVNLDIDAPRTAVLTGGSVAAAVGSFSYRVLGGGRVAPDPAWVAANIRTETLPVVGRVTCHKVMLKQLRQVMLEIQARGLASKVYNYGGCYVPRFIAGSGTLSFHTFGTAIDLNVADNQRGTVGKMDRSVVRIFEDWGFTWGGNWRYTDPMHFELARLVSAG